MTTAGPERVQGVATVPTPTPVASFPRVLYIRTVEDTGPDSGARCPHCGADGRYIIWFVTEDGATRGAMRGCIKLFPKSSLALVTGRIIDRVERYRKNKWKVTSWDENVLDALDTLERGEMTLQEFATTVAQEIASRGAYLHNKYGRR